MDFRGWLFSYVAIALIPRLVSVASRHSLGSAEIAAASASLPAPQEKTSELEVSLFVQDPHLKNGKKGIHVIWIPQQIQKYCLGKTSEECSTIDYCIRTTNRQAAMCQHLSVDTTRLPAYPPESVPRRVLSVVYFFPIATDRGFGILAELFDGAPKGSLDHLSQRARIKAKVKLTRSADDDQFEVLEFLAAPST
jgi:hypothetical protein